MLYPDGVSGDGIMMTVDFKLLGTDKSYQPELKINSLIDSSNEMNEIPYSIKYQQKCTNKRDCKCNREGRTVCKAGNTTRITQIWNGNKGRELK